VRSAATDNGTQRDHHVILTGFRQCVSRQRQLIRAWNPNNGNVFIFDLANTLQGVNRAIQQAVVDKVVETRNGDGDASVGVATLASIMFILFLRVQFMAPQGADSIIIIGALLPFVRGNQAFTKCRQISGPT
jgi:hypothetical protein